ncbi:MAG: hypothetical protein N2746_00175 [Deltaproteobacteria bacterium]|nr:hypothetical protein [Deltaproteobacteria bacterium]
MIIGYFVKGTLKDRSFKTIGYLKEDGKIQNSLYNTVGYVNGLNPGDDRCIAAYILIFEPKLLGESN